MERFIPYITTGLALAAFFAALYFRSVRDFARQNVESLRSLAALPPRSRIDAVKVFTNVFDIDVGKLTPSKQYDLALRIFEKRERDSRRGFYLLIFTGIALSAGLVAFVAFSRDTPAIIAAAIEANPSGAADALKEKKFFKIDDKSLMEELNSYIEENLKHKPPSNAFEYINKYNNVVEKQPLLSDMRTRAFSGAAPFQRVGEVVVLGVPDGTMQPPNGIAYVQIGSPYEGAVIQISLKERSPNSRNLSHLRLVAQGRIANLPGNADLHLNYAQFDALSGGSLKTTTTEALIVPTKLAQYDPTCPTLPGLPACPVDAGGTSLASTVAMSSGP